jgi:hypothetical protein
VNRPTPKNNISNKKTAIFFVVSAATFLLCIATPRSAWPVEATTHESSGTFCALLENFGGDVEVLDPSRTRVVSLTKTSGIPCGGWVSSGNGWAIIHHRDGHDLRIGPNTFLEVPEFHPDASNADGGSDQVVLYRGEMFGSTEGGAGELRVITANARVRVKHGTALINFSPDEQDTQLVALDGPSSLENRFEPSKKVEAKAGEATNLNFKQLRVVPAFPKAISIASLRGKLGQFRINEQAQSKIYETAQARADRRLAADLSDVEKAQGADDKGVVHEDEKVVSDRTIASEGTVRGRKRYSYSRNAMGMEETNKMKAQWTKKMTAGEDIGEKILYPDKFYGKPQKVKVLISDPAEQMNAQKAKTEDVEKKRLIEELSQIRED